MRGAAGFGEVGPGSDPDMGRRRIYQRRFSGNVSLFTLVARPDEMDPTAAVVRAGMEPDAFEVLGGGEGVGDRPGTTSDTKQTFAVPGSVACWRLPDRVE